MGKEQKPKKILEIRKALIGKLRKKKPKFRRYHWFKYSLPDNWRKPRGIHSKIRQGEDSRPRGPSDGFITPFAIRGLHPSGYEEILVKNATDLQSIKPETQAARFSSALGGKKRKFLAEKAAQLKIKVLNP